MRSSGLVDVVPTDLTTEVTPFVAARLAFWQSDEANHRRKLGDEAYAALKHFYCVVARLFMDGKIGCVRLTAESRA